MVFSIESVTSTKPNPASCGKGHFRRNKPPEMLFNAHRPPSRLNMKREASRIMRDSSRLLQTLSRDHFPVNPDSRFSRMRTRDYFKRSVAITFQSTLKYFTGPYNIDGNSLYERILPYA
jgi:hypothetical protein